MLNLNVNWKSLDIPNGAEWYQPKDTVSDCSLDRFFKNNFKHVYVPSLITSWQVAQLNTNPSGSIKIPEQYVSIDEKELITEVVQKHSHYFRDVSKLEKVDFYMLARLFNVTDPCLQHIFKKVIAAGNRGHKDYQQDIQDIFDTAKRLLEIEEELK